MLIIYKKELVEVQSKKEWSYKGLHLVLHRPFESETAWNVSEYTTGKQVGLSGKTMGEAIERAQRTVDYFEKQVGGNDMLILFMKANKTINLPEVKKVGDMVQNSLF